MTLVDDSARRTAYFGSEDTKKISGSESLTIIESDVAKNPFGMSRFDMAKYADTSSYLIRFNGDMGGSIYSYKSAA